MDSRIKPAIQGKPSSRIDLLQRAEERYYASSCPKRKVRPFESVSFRESTVH